MAGILILATHMATPLIAEEPQGDWDQFRGPVGTGIAEQNELPTTWSEDSANIRWKTEIRGEGASSPVVKNGRVFLTTAYDGSMGGFSRALAKTLGYTVSALMFLVALAVLARRASGHGPTSQRTFLGTADRVMGLAGFALFLIVGLLAILGPGYINQLLSAVGTLLQLPGARTIARVLDLKAYHIKWEVGEYRSIWIISGGITMLGLAASAAWCRPGSRWRLVAAAAVFLWLIPQLYVGVPFIHKRALDDLNPFPLGHKLYFALPALLLACWYVAAFLCVRAFETKGENAAVSSGSLGKAALSVLTLIAAGIAFVPVNFLQPQFGLIRAALCIDLETGKTLWEKQLFVAPPERKHGTNTYASPTCCIDDERVYAAFGSRLICMDHDGNLLWEEVDQEYHSNWTRYGAASSPVLAADKVILLKGRETGSTRPSSLEAFDRKTGDSLWKIDPEVLDTYSTPIVIPTADGEQVVLNTHRKVASYDAATGKELWELENITEQQAASIARGGNLLCMGAGSAGPHDVLVMRLEGSGEASRVEQLWNTKKRAPCASSPVIYKGRLYTVTKQGVVSCYDAESGKEHWKTRIESRVKAGNNYVPSAVAGAGRVYILGDDGRTTVIDASDELKIVAQNDLDGRCASTPALLEGRILIRTDTRLVCIGTTAGAEG
jgi:outer membrane protein assembly factor BamB